MKIDSASLKPVSGSSPQGGPARAGKGPSASGAAGAGAGSQSSPLQGLAAAVAAAPAVDAAKVEEIKQAIAQGRFTVNPNTVADRLLETARELLQVRGS